MFFFFLPGMAVHICNLGTWEAEARTSRVSSQPGLQSETLSQNNKIKRKERNRTCSLHQQSSFPNIEIRGLGA
jgi:hypothetical protein